MSGFSVTIYGLGGGLYLAMLSMRARVRAERLARESLIAEADAVVRLVAT
jgi:hypothetical protein